jgi:hypothetical protein
MTVGQGDSRNQLDAGKDIIRVPPPVDISSAPSHALAGKGNIYKLNFYTISTEKFIV